MILYYYLISNGNIKMMSLSFFSKSTQWPFKDTELLKIDTDYWKSKFLCSKNETLCVQISKKTK